MTMNNNTSMKLLCDDSQYKYTGPNACTVRELCSGNADRIHSM